MLCSVVLFYIRTVDYVYYFVIYYCIDHKQLLSNDVNNIYLSSFNHICILNKLVLVVEFNLQTRLVPFLKRDDAVIAINTYILKKLDLVDDSQHRL